jgi:hypothetical protein
VSSSIPGTAMFLSHTFNFSLLFFLFLCLLFALMDLLLLVTVRLIIFRGMPVAFEKIDIKNFQFSSAPTRKMPIFLVTATMVRAPQEPEKTCDLFTGASLCLFFALFVSSKQSFCCARRPLVWKWRKKFRFARLRMKRCASI